LILIKNYFNRAIKRANLLRFCHKTDGFRQHFLCQSKLLAEIRAFRIIAAMRTVIETLEFQHQASKIWSEVQRDTFIEWIAANPLAGDVIPSASGARKVRWAASGRGKRGGARVIFSFNSARRGAVDCGVCESRAQQYVCTGN
jgi:hypothetical protein